VEGSCEHGNEPSGFHKMLINSSEVERLLSLKMDSGPWS
jgi:hypothetical protein